MSGEYIFLPELVPVFKLYHLPQKIKKKLTPARAHNRQAKK